MAGKLGLGHLETLVENLDRDLNLADTTFTGLTSLDFLLGYQGNLTATGIDISDAEAVAGLATATAGEILATTLIKNAINTFAGTNSAAGSMCYLPPALLGDHLVLEITSEIDDTTNALPIKCVGAVGASANVFAKQVIGVNTGGIAGSAVETAGTAASPTSVNLIYTPAAAATNFLGPGSMIHFYCPKDGQWLVNVRSCPKGTGATGAFTVS
tara:strand:- start:4793 stop:5431 length:639 start_codon:yes stop_codon:yes gene_type:complete